MTFMNHSIIQDRAGTAQSSRLVPSSETMARWIATPPYSSMFATSTELPASHAAQAAGARAGSRLQQRRAKRPSRRSALQLLRSAFARLCRSSRRLRSPSQPPSPRTQAEGSNPFDASFEAAAPAAAPSIDDAFGAPQTAAAAAAPIDNGLGGGSAPGSGGGAPLDDSLFGAAMEESNGAGPPAAEATPVSRRRPLALGRGRGSNVGGAGVWG